MPLWASYLVKAYAWRGMFANGRRPRLGRCPVRVTAGLRACALLITLAYLWLPYMILPIFTGLERLPDSLLEASADLGARPGGPSAP